jgi:ABC-type multidrug transport system ATPase subunit
VIRIRNVSKSFGTARVLDDVSMDIEAGESVALWGPNGAGKTTLIRCVLGLLRFEGEIRVGGRCVTREGKSARMLIGYVPQELGFHDDLLASEALGFFGRLRGLHLGRKAILKQLESVGLGGHGRKRVRELSGGMKQRLALAVALLGEPPVLVLDEVTASLDACGREEFLGLLAGLRGSGRTLLFASHRIDEVTTLARRVAMIERGRLMALGEARDLARSLGVGAVLHIMLDTGRRDEAVAQLRRGGFSPRLNGRGILVPVPESQKAVPFRVLAEARIPFDDFEVLPGKPGDGEVTP